MESTRKYSAVIHPGGYRPLESDAEVFDVCWMYGSLGSGESKVRVVLVGPVSINIPIVGDRRVVDASIIRRYGAV